MDLTRLREYYERIVILLRFSLEVLERLAVVMTKASFLETSTVYMNAVKHNYVVQLIN